MILETIVLSSALGYIGGSVIGRGTTIVETDKGIKLLAVDIKEGYQKSMQDKNFRLMRDVALMSSVAYVYARDEARSRAIREKKKLEAIKTYDTLCNESEKVASVALDMRYDDYRGLADHIMENPGMNKRVAYMTRPSTGINVDEATFQQIFDSVRRISEASPELANEGVKKLMDIYAIDHYRRDKEAIKELSAKELLRGRGLATKMRIEDLSKGKMPTVSR